VLSFDEIVGQPTALHVLRGVLSTRRLPHALLFHGPAGVGKATTALTFAATLVCERDAQQACGSCDSCGLIARGNHPDLLRVTRLTRKEIDRQDRARLSTQDPEAAEGDLGSLILVDQIRTLNGLVGLRPRQGRRRVLLKTLEEPPERSLLVLISSRPHLLLPTVRSRCFSVGFTAMRANELSAVLEARGISRTEAAARAALAAGSLGDAIALDLDARRERRQTVYEMLDTLSGGSPAIDKLPAMAAALAGKDQATLLDGLDMAQALLRDAARADCVDGAEGLVHADLVRDLERLGGRLGSDRAATLVAGVDRLRASLRINANRTLIAETLLAAVAGGPLP